MESVIINVRNIDKAIWKQMRELAFKREVAVGYILNEAMEEYLKQTKKDKKNENSN
jgi:hypothetical protein